jgi:hypothetical protein
LVESQCTSLAPPVKDKKASGFFVSLLFCWRKQQTLPRLPSEAAESLLRRKRRLKESLQTLAEKLVEAPYRGF